MDPTAVAPKETGLRPSMSPLSHVVLIELGWLFESQGYKPGSILRKLKQNKISSSNIPSRLQVRTSLGQPDDLSDRSKSPRKQPFLSAFYLDLRDGFKSSQLNDDSKGLIKVRPRTFDVCWRKAEPGEEEPVWGKVMIEQEVLEILEVKHRVSGDLLKTVRLGHMEDYHLGDSSVWYCFDNDMLYFLPTECCYITPSKPHYYVYPFRSFAELVAEFD